MNRIKNFGAWIGAGLVGCGVFMLCMAIAFWDSVVMGRNFDDQMDSADDAPRT